MTKTSFIYFDLGNVLLDFDHQIACQRIARRAAVDDSQVHEVIFESGLQEEYERGKLDSQMFARRITQAIGADLEVEFVLRACSEIFASTWRANIIAWVCGCPSPPMVP